MSAPLVQSPPLTTTITLSQASTQTPQKLHKRARSIENRKNSFYAQDRPVFLDKRLFSTNVQLPKLSSTYTLHKHGRPEKVQTGQSFSSTEVDPLLHNLIYKCGRHNCGTSQTIGKRTTMEDMLIVVGGLFPSIDYYAVFDGHNGDQASAIAACNLQRKLCADLVKGEGCAEHLKRAFSELHEEVCQQTESGTTASVVIVRESDVVFSLIGDSPVYILSEHKIKRIGKDHKPEDIEENLKIMRNGGKVTNCGGVLRVNEKIAITRSIGDKALHPPLSCEPDYFSVPIQNIQKILIASDGIAVLSECALEQIMNDTLQPEEISRVIRNIAYEKDSGDNISVIVIDLTS
ncbi:protein phosphatase 1K, putative [Entamoeba invadens IP1]|uniref:Protein phosphatase 1K, putative n=1 Tax=Entamoeba invadens IP1 TaxID=370355 RepID=A0A0A1UF35_ENTIV|nr:protein phosphatase 1K, putative [Entamoeba invadens IP1]ELP95221.1 protein phosphatase 1K, putative [Entamoeba invadens IP1]|eukprot:XP_004261992.1 protein phosphatase 1K, putative [Entamoeba invadens IP1]